MTDPSENLLPLSDLAIADVDTERSNYHIYTHARRSKIFILMLLLTYMLLFYFFSLFLFNKLGDLSDVPTAFSSASDYGSTQLGYFASAIVGWLFGLSIMSYFVWNAIDVWGLEVWVSEQRIRVVNQVLGSRLQQWTGIGAMEMEEIQEIYPGRTVTRLRSKQIEIRFSPVEHLDRLAATISANAVNAKIIEK